MDCFNQTIADLQSYRYFTKDGKIEFQRILAIVLGKAMVQLASHYGLLYPILK